jgi:hypothetical protein
MPVRRFRSVEEMEGAVWMDRDDPRLWPTIASVWRLSERLCPMRFPPGLYRHRSIEEMNRQTEVWQAGGVMARRTGK